LDLEWSWDTFVFAKKNNTSLAIIFQAKKQIGTKQIRRRVVVVIEVLQEENNRQ
jgi:hypothetical protein